MTVTKSRDHDVKACVRLDIGLDIIMEHLPDGVTLSIHDIADICGVDHTYIWQIEQQIIRKLRNTFKDPRIQ
jgi:hypothetical protein